MRRFPDDEIGQFPDFDAANYVADSLGERGIDRVFADIALDSVVIGAGALVLFESAPLLHVLVSCIPGAEDDLAASAHGLRVGRHDADGARVVQDVFGRNGLCADAAVREGDVLGDVLGQMVAGHDHVEMLVDSVAGVRFSRIGAAGNDVGMLDERYHVRSVATTRTLDVVGVDSSPAKRGGSSLDVARLI